MAGTRSYKHAGTPEQALLLPIEQDPRVLVEMYSLLRGRKIMHVAFADDPDKEEEECDFTDGPSVAWFTLDNGDVLQLIAYPGLSAHSPDGWSRITAIREFSDTEIGQVATRIQEHYDGSITMRLLVWPMDPGVSDGTVIAIVKGAYEDKIGASTKLAYFGKLEQ